MLRRIKELDVLESFGNWNNELREERFIVRSKLEKILLEQERVIRMKTKVTWAKQGDANTRLFHSLLNARKSKNVITELELEDGSFVDRGRYRSRDYWFLSKSLQDGGVELQGHRWYRMATNSIFSCGLVGKTI